MRASKARPSPARASRRSCEEPAATSMRSGTERLLLWSRGGPRMYEHVLGEVVRHGQWPANRKIPRSAELEWNAAEHRLEMRVAPARVARLGVDRDAPKVIARAAGRLPIADRLLLDQVWSLERAPLIAAAAEKVNQPLSVLDHHADGDRLTGVLCHVTGGVRERLQDVAIVLAAA